MAADNAPRIPAAGFGHVPGLPEVLAEVSRRLDREMTDSELQVFKAVIEVLVIPLVQQWADLGSWVEEARMATVTELQQMLSHLEI